MRRLELREYARTPAVELAPAECDALRRVVPSLVVEPAAGRPGRYDLTPKSLVGTVTVGDLIVTIQPKVALDRLLFLLSYAMDPVGWRDLPSSYGEDEMLTEVIIPAFVLQLRRAFRAGLLKGYRHEEDSAMTVRGRIRFAALVGRRFGVPLPAEVAYDDFTEDIEENRLLKAALGRLLRMPTRREEFRQLLLAFQGPLVNVSLVDHG
jgi:5-methylcytosine-specific restriction enzyme subunit McrC